MSTDWSESDFSKHILDVFDHHDIEYQTEVPLRSLGDSTRSESRIDIYIPKTDTAIELKGKKGDLERGLGQAMNYTRVCKEAIVMLDGEASNSYRQDIHRTCQIAPAVHFAMVIPNANPNTSKADLDVRTDSRPDLFHKMLYGPEWSDDIAILKPLIPEYIDHEEKRWTRSLGDQSLNAYQQNSDLKDAIMEYVESSNSPVSVEDLIEDIPKFVDDIDNYDSSIYDAFDSLCREQQLVKLKHDNYTERFDFEP